MVSYRELTVLSTIQFTRFVGGEQAERKLKLESKAWRQCAWTSRDIH